MGALSLPVAKLVLTDLLENRRESLWRLPAGARHEALLRALSVEVEAAVARAAVPVVDPVGGLVEQHVEVTRALGAVLTAQRINPLEPDPVREAAARLHSTFVAGRLGRAHRAAARVGYADEACHKRPLFAAELALLTPAAGALLDRLIALGQAIGVALGQRSALAPPPARAPQALVRAVSVALARIRRDARAALALYDDLPPNLEAHLLGYADALAERRRPRREAPEVEATAPSVEPPDAARGDLAPPVLEVGPVEPVESRAADAPVDTPGWAAAAGDCERPTEATRDPAHPPRPPTARMARPVGFV